MSISTPASRLGLMKRCRLPLLVVSVSLLSALLASPLTGCGNAHGTTVSQKSVKSIGVAPATANMAVGATQQFTATATYNDSTTANVTSMATWTTANSAIATVSSSGMVTAIAAGTTTVTASQSGVSGTASITVAASAPTLKSIAVTPASPSIVTGATQQFTATATYSDGSTGNITSQASWSSSNQSIATVSSSGLSTGVAAGAAVITATLNGVSGTASLTVTSPVATLASIAVTPSSPSIAAGDTQQFTATGTYSDGSTANVTSQASWSSSDKSVATVDSSGLATGASAGSAKITATLSGITGSASLTVTAATGGGGGAVDITTWHVDNNRSGLNSNETTLTPGTVNPSSFGKRFSYIFNGYAYGEPLIVSNLTINGANHDVLYVATEADMVYAFDADNGSSTPLWSTSLLNSGETPLTNGAIKPYEGVTSTPVIDLSSNTIYVVSEQQTGSGGTFRLNALSLLTGKPQIPAATITGSVSGSVAKNDTLTTSCVQRAALLLANGNIYIGVGGCPAGWLFAYNASTLAQVAVWNASPNQAGVGPYASAGGVWMGSGGPVADSNGNIYIVTGNGPWDGKTAWGDSVIKFSPSLQIEDSFTPDAYEYLDCADVDFAAGGLMMIPGTADIVAGGKTGRVYLLNGGNLGGEHTNDTGALDRVWFESDLSPPYTSQPCPYMSGNPTGEISSYEIFGTSAYFNGYVYLGISPTGSSTVAPVRQFAFSGSSNTLTPGAYSGPASEDQPLNTRGTTPFISSNGNQDGIVWMINEGVPLQQGTPTAATLYAYDAQNFPDQIYSSSTNSADVPGYGIKFTSPVVANGKVYISTGHDPTTAANPRGEIDVYGEK